MLPAKETERIVQTGALFVLGAVEVDAAAAMAGLPTDEFLTQCEAPDVQRQIEAEILRLRITGKSSELRAALALDTLTAKLTTEVETADMLPGTAVRVGEFLLRTSGLEQKRGAELRTAAPEQKFFLAVVNPGDSVPEIPPGTKHGLIINLTGKPLERTNDGE